MAAPGVALQGHAGRNDSDGRLLAVLAFLSFVMVFSNTIIAPLITPIGHEFSIGAGVAGLAAASYGVPGIALGVLVGPYSDRFGRKPFLLGGIMLIGGFNLLAAFAPSFPLLIVARALAGFGAPMIFANIQAGIADLFPYSERGRALGLVVAVNQAGPLLGIPLAGFLAEAFSWRLSLVVVSLLAMTAALVVWRRYPSIAQARNLAGRRALIGSVLQNRSARLAFGGFLLTQIGWFAWLTYLVVFFERTYSLTPAIAATLATINGLGIACGSVVGGRFGDRGRRRDILLVTSIGLVVTFLLATQISVPLPVGAFIVFTISACIGARFGATAVQLVEQVPAARGTMGSLMASLNGIGLSAGPASGGVLLDRGGFGALGVWCAACIFLSGIFFLGVREPDPRDREAHVAR